MLSATAPIAEPVKLYAVVVSEAELHRMLDLH